MGGQQSTNDRGVSTGNMKTWLLPFHTTRNSFNNFKITILHPLKVDLDRFSRNCTFSLSVKVAKISVP